MAGCGDDRLSTFDIADEPVVFLGCFLLDDGAVPEIEFTAQARPGVPSGCRDEEAPGPVA